MVEPGLSGIDLKPPRAEAILPPAGGPPHRFAVTERRRRSPAIHPSLQVGGNALYIGAPINDVGGEFVGKTCRRIAQGHVPERSGRGHGGGCHRDKRSTWRRRFPIAR